MPGDRALTFGAGSIAVRDKETRLYFAGYKPYAFKVFAFAVGAMLAGVVGMLYSPQVDDHPAEHERRGLNLHGDLGRAGRTRPTFGRGFRRIARQCAALLTLLRFAELLAFRGRRRCSSG